MTKVAPVQDDDAELAEAVRIEARGWMMTKPKRAHLLHRAADRLERIASRLSPSTEEGVLRSALEPFAQAADYYDTRPSDDPPYEDTGPYADNIVAGPAGIQVKHYRQARAALAGKSGEGG